MSEADPEGKEAMQVSLQVLIDRLDTLQARAEDREKQLQVRTLGGATGAS